MNQSLAKPVQQVEPREPIPIRREPSAQSARTQPPDTSETVQPPAPEPAPTASAGDVSVQVVVERWQEVRTEVKAADRKVEALLASCDPYSIMDGTLYLVAAYPFHATKLNEDRNRTTIEAAVERVTGHRMSVSTGLRDELPEAQPDPAPPDTGQPRRSTPRQVRDADPAADDDEEPYQANPPEEQNANHDSDGQERQIMERMKAMFNGEEIDVEDLPLDVNPSS